MARSLPMLVRAPPLLPTGAEYALRALAELAAPEHEGQAVRCADLASATDVPEAYLAKILRRLARHGVLRADKGHGGGFSLANPAHRVRFFEVFEALGAMPSPDRCAFGRLRCSSANPCPLHPAWSKLYGAFAQWARTTTVADVARGAAGPPPALALERRPRRGKPVA